MGVEQHFNIVFRFGVQILYASIVAYIFDVWILYASIGAYRFDVWIQYAVIGAYRFGVRILYAAIRAYIFGKRNLYAPIGERFSWKRNGLSVVEGAQFLFNSVLHLEGLEPPSWSNDEFRWCRGCKTFKMDVFS